MVASQFSVMLRPLGGSLGAVRAGLRRASSTSVVSVVTLGLLAGTAAAEIGGVDVSRWQHGASLNWSKVKADGVDFAFIKATEGRSYTNPYFASDWAATTRVGIYRGAYHFARPSTGTAATQARYFVSKAGVAGKKGDLPPVLDLESSGGLGVSAMRAWTATWLQTVKRLTGRTPIIYASPAFWEYYLGDSSAFRQYPLWVAHYGVSKPRVPGGWSTWTFWQRTNTGHVTGISGNVDLNVFNGSTAKLAALANGTRPPAGGGTPTGPTTPTKSASTTSLEASAHSVYAGQRLTLSGTLLSATKVRLPHRTVALYRKKAGAATYSLRATTRTNRAGVFSFPVAPRVSTTYQARFAGGRLYTRSRSAPVATTVVPRIATRVDLHSDPARAAAGTMVTFYGHLRTAKGAAVVGRRVRLYQRLSGRSWTQVGTGRSVAPTGWWQVRWEPRTGASYKAVWPGGTKYAASSSARLAAPVS